MVLLPAAGAYAGRAGQRPHPRRDARALRAGGRTSPSTRASASSAIRQTARMPRRWCSERTSRCTWPRGAGRRGVYDPVEDPHDAGRLRLGGELRMRSATASWSCTISPSSLQRPGAGRRGSAGALAAPEPRIPSARRLHPTGRGNGLIRPLHPQGAAQRCEPMALPGTKTGSRSPSPSTSRSPTFSTTSSSTISSAILSEEKMAAECLVLEITESTVMTDPRRTIAVLETPCRDEHQVSRWMTTAPASPRWPTSADSPSTSSKSTEPSSNISPPMIRTSRSSGQPSTWATAWACGLSPKASRTRGLSLCSKTTPATTSEGFYLGRPVPPDALLNQLHKTTPWSRTPPRDRHRPSLTKAECGAPSGNIWPARRPAS